VTASISYSNAAVHDLLGRGYRQNENGLIDAARMPHHHSMYVGQERVRRYGYDARGWLRSFSDEIYQPTVDGSCPRTGQLVDDNGICVQGQGEATWVLGGPTYTYDRTGNRTDRGAAVDLGNRLTGFDGHFLAYDENGNLTRRVKPGVDDLTPVWNSLGQMTSAWRYQKGTVSYGYDAFGRRVRRTAPDGSVTRFLYDGDDLLMELDGAGNPIREYTYYPGVDRPHSVRSGGQTYYYANPGAGRDEVQQNGGAPGTAVRRTPRVILPPPSRSGTPPRPSPRSPRGPWCS
jgi:YD repeat-containing protein